MSLTNLMEFKKEVGMVIYSGQDNRTMVKGSNPRVKLAALEAFRDDKDEIEIKETSA